MKVKIMLVTPEQAKLWLDGANHGNRPHRGWWSAALAQVMKRGGYIQTHQGIAFTEDGRLLDGQHRLWAIVISGCAQEMAVFTGVDDRAFQVIDCGIKRTMADLTGLSKKTAEVCRVAATILHGGSVLTDQVLAVANTGLAEVSDGLNEYCGSARKIYASAHMRLAACALVMDGFPRQEVFKRYRDLILDKFEELPAIALAFIRQVNAGKVQSNGGPTGRYDLLARALKVLRPDNAGLTRIQITESDAEAASAYVRGILKRLL